MNGGGGIFGTETYIKTKLDNALYFTSNGAVAGLDFDTSDGNFNFDVGHSASGNGAQLLAEDYRQEVLAISASGKVLIYRSVTGVHLLGADCIFSGRVTTQ